MKKIHKIILIGGLVICIGLVVVTQYGESGSSIEVRAYEQTQEYVKEMLRTPSTALFPPLEEIMVGQITSEQFEAIQAEEIYGIESYVDSQNAFGATLRTDYSIMLRYTGGDPKEEDSWWLVTLYLDGEDVTENFLDYDGRITYQECLNGKRGEEFCNNFLLGN